MFHFFCLFLCNCERTRLFYFFLPQKMPSKPESKSNSNYPSSFVVVDIDYTGGDLQRDSMVGLSLLRLDESGTVGAAWHSLVRPNKQVSDLALSFLHISPSELAQAPAFDDIAEQILAFTEGAVLTGFQMRLQYGFLLQGFKNTPFRFRKEHICLTRLMRQHFLPPHPGTPTAAFADMGIPFSVQWDASKRCRAMATLFERLFLHSRDGASRQHIKQTAFMAKLPPNLNPERVDTLPSATGVYYFTGKRGEMLYLGKSLNIKKRVLSHFADDVHLSSKHRLKMQTCDVQYRTTGSELIALLLESDEIKRFMPTFNRAQRRRTYTHAVYIYKNSDNYSCLRIERVKPNGNAPLLKFASNWGAVQFVVHTAFKHGLHPLLCNLLAYKQWWIHAEGSPDAFDEPLPDHEVHEQQISELIRYHSYPSENMLLIEKGRTNNEISVIWIAQNQYKGYAYLPVGNSDNDNNSISADTFIPSLETVQEMLIPMSDNPDVQQIIRAYLRRKPCPATIVPFD